MQITLHESTKSNLLFLGLALIIIFIFPQEVFAGGTEEGGGLPYETWLENLRTSMTGPVALTFALLGIIGAGGALIFMGAELNGFIRTIVFLVLVISIIIGANDLLVGYGGSGTEIAMASDKEEETLLAMIDINRMG